MAHVVVMQPPAAEHTLPVLRDLSGGERSSRRSAVPRHRHERRGPVGEPDAGAGEGHLHHLPRVIARRMLHPLLGRGDVERRGVVIDAEVRGDAAPPRRVDEIAQRAAAGGIHDRLGRFDHQLEAQRPARELVPPLQRLESRHQGRHLLRDDDLRQRDGEVRGQPTVRSLEQRPEEQLQRAQRPLGQVLAQRLDADPDERRQCPRHHPRRHLAGGGARGGVLLGVGAVAVPVLEINAEVLHRLAAQLFSNPVVHRGRQLRRETDGGSEGLRVRCILVEGAQREVAELARRVGAEQVGATVYRVHGLAGGRRGLLACRHENAGHTPRRSS